MSRSTSSCRCRPGAGERFVTFRFFLRQEQSGRRPGTRSHSSSSPCRDGFRSELAAAPCEAQPGRRSRDRARAGGDRSRDGCPPRLALDGRNVLLDGPRLQLWRAPTDNDGLPHVPSRRSGVLPRWLELGLDRLQLGVVSARADGSDCRARASGRRPGHAHRQRYRLRDNGELLVENVVRLAPGPPRPAANRGRAHPPAGPRAARLVRPRPVGGYSDRLASTVVGRFESTVTDQYVPYILPQEHGHHRATSAGSRSPTATASGSRSRDYRRSGSRRATSRPPTSTRPGTPTTSSRGPRCCSASTTLSAGSAPPAAAPTRRRATGCSSRATPSVTCCGRSRRATRTPARSRAAAAPSRSRAASRTRRARRAPRRRGTPRPPDRRSAGSSPCRRRR